MKIQLPALFLLLSLSLGANPGLPPIQLTPEESKPVKAEVRETGAFRELPGSGAQVNHTENTPPGMLAARTARQGVYLSWMPSEDSSRLTGGADLAGAALSPDESLLVIAEKVGGKGPNSTRLVGFNLYNDHLSTGLVLPGRRLTDMSFLADGRLLAVQEGQPDTDHPRSGLVLLDLTDPEGIHLLPLEQPPVSVAANPQFAWFTVAGEDGFTQIRLSNGTVEHFKSLVPSPRLTLTPDGKRLFLYGKGRLECYAWKNRRLELEYSQPLPGDYTPEMAYPASADGSYMVFAEPGRAAYLVGGGNARLLEARAGNTGCFFPAERKLLLGVQRNEGYAIYATPFAEAAERTVSPREVKPITRNENFRIFPRTGSEMAAILIDHRANVWQLEIRARRWEKKAVFTPGKNL